MRNPNLFGSLEVRGYADLGYLNDYPDHWTQGEHLEDLKEHLRDLFQIFSSEQIPRIRKVEELEIA